MSFPKPEIAVSILGVLALLVVASPSAAASQGAGGEPRPPCTGLDCSFGEAGEGGVSAGMGGGREAEGPQPQPQPGSAEAEASPCEFRNDLFSPVLSEDEIEQVTEANEGVEVELEGPRLRSVWRDCGDGFELIMWWEDDGEGANPVAGLLTQVLAEVRPGPVPMTVQPPAQPGVVVGLPAYFSIDAAAAGGSTASASAGGFTVTVSAVPSQLVIDVGEGDPLVCGPPGTRYVSGQDHPADGCTHLFTEVPDGGSTVVSSHIVYAASYQVSGPGLSGTFDLGTFDGATTDTDVTIRQVRGVRTS